MIRRIEVKDLPLLAAMAAEQSHFGPVKKPVGGRLNPCAVVPGEKKKSKPRHDKKRRPAFAVQPVLSRRQREMKRPWERIMLAYVRGEIQPGQKITIAQLRDLFMIHHGEELQIDLAFVRAPFRLVRVGLGPFEVRAA
jgi:hypothetical protein